MSTIFDLRELMESIKRQGLRPMMQKDGFLVRLHDYGYIQALYYGDNQVAVIKHNETLRFA
jgi:hypothetical protein